MPGIAIFRLVLSLNFLGDWLRDRWDPKTSPIVNAPPELVAVGHVTWDVSPDDISTREPGGAVAFAAVTADRLGVRAGIVTACANDYPMSEVPIANGMWRVVASEETSTFENRYDERGDRGAGFTSAWK